MGCKLRLIKKRANHSSDNRWQCRLRKTHFLFFSLLPGISSFKGMGGNNNPLLLCGVHQESEVKPITSFQLRLIFFPAFFFFFCHHLGDLCEDFILGSDLESYSDKCRPKGSFFNTLSVCWDLKA